jgi:hypothetical protein
LMSAKAYFQGASTRYHIVDGGGLAQQQSAALDLCTILHVLERYRAEEGAPSLPFLCPRPAQTVLPTPRRGRISCEEHRIGAIGGEPFLRGRLHPLVVSQVVFPDHILFHPHCKSSLTINLIHRSLPRPERPPWTIQPIRHAGNSPRVPQTSGFPPVCTRKQHKLLIGVNQRDGATHLLRLMRHAAKPLLTLEHRFAGPRHTSCTWPTPAGQRIGKTQITKHRP